MWQDIKTAPESKDIMVFFSNGTILPVLKRKNEWYFYNGDPIYGSHKITHWMPFPEPPRNDTP